MEIIVVAARGKIDPFLWPRSQACHRARGLDGRWHKEETRAFLVALRDFATVTAFDGFCEAHRPLCDKGIMSCRAALAQFDLTAWFDDLFGPAEALLDRLTRHVHIVAMHHASASESVPLHGLTKPI